MERGVTEVTLVRRGIRSRLRSTVFEGVVGPHYGRRVNPQRLLRRLARGSVKNVTIDDMQRLVEAFVFELKRVSGSHHIFGHPEVPELVNLQEVRGEAKPYQIRQFLRLVERY